MGLDSASDAHITLHLNAPDGPILDTEDLLSDALPDAEEKVFAVINDGSSAGDVSVITCPLIPSSLTLRSLNLDGTPMGLGPLSKLLEDGFVYE